jgi:hypothetical protein
MAEQAISTVVPVKQHTDQALDRPNRKRGLSAVREHEFQWLSHVVYMALSEALSLIREAEKAEQLGRLSGETSGRRAGGTARRPSTNP